jgi:Flp pilus assembly protein TadG
MTLRHRHLGRRRGTAAIEFAVILLFLVPLLIGLWEVGRLVEVEQHLNNAVREGARQASTGNSNTAAVQQVVVTYLAVNGITITTSNVTVTNITSSSRNDPTTANQLDQFHIAVQMPFNNVRWVLLNQITNAKTLSASTEFYSMRDVPLSINSTIPVN